jgi:prolyl oligopeptidase
LLRRELASSMIGRTLCLLMSPRNFLEEQKIAGRGKVALWGGSNGGMSSLPMLYCSQLSRPPGLLVAACVNRAPEGTFGAAIADVGVHDYLKV